MDGGLVIGPSLCTCCDFCSDRCLSWCCQGVEEEMVRGDGCLSSL